MAHDPLSVAATVLPPSTFDPVQWAIQSRQEMIKNQEARRTRFNELMGEMQTPSAINPEISLKLISERNKLIEEGASSMAEGIDVTDITNPKFSRQAADYRQKLTELNTRATKSLLFGDLVKKTTDLLAKDYAEHGENGVFDKEATQKNIEAVKNAKSIEEIDRFISKKGDNLLVTRFQPINVGELVKKELPNYVAPESVEYTTEKGGKRTTVSYDKMDPTKVKDAMYRMYNGNKQLQETIKREKETDPMARSGESDIEYFYRNYGTPKLRQKYSTKTEPIKTTEEEKPLYKISNEPVKTTISIKGNKYETTGENPVTFDQSKTFLVSPGSGTISIATGRDAGIKGSIDFTPVNTAEYYVSKVKYKGWPAGTILPKGNYSGNPNVIKKRFVEGVYDVGAGVNKKTQTIFVPYENIKNELDAAYKVVPEVDKLKENTDPLGIF